MSKEITKAIVLQQLQDKLGLRDYEVAPFLFSETVIPIYDIGPHFKHRKIEYASRDIAATGNVIFFVVPQNERWKLQLYDVVFMGAGAYTVAGATIRRLDGLPDTVYLDMTAAQTISYHVSVSPGIVLDPADAIGINVDGYTSPQALRLYIDYEVEEIR